MSIQIKPMETDSEIRGKAYVHWKAWHEAYPGIVDAAYLDNLTLEKCTDIAFRWTENLLVAKDGQKVVGFVGYGQSSDETLTETGEVYAIYILQEYYGKKVGCALMTAAIEKLSEYKRIAVWVLEDNQRAIKFYERCGFRFDGTRKPITLGTPNTEIRMILNQGTKTRGNNVVQSTVKVSMRDGNNLNCSYAIVSKANSSVLVILKDSECAIVDYDSLKAERYTYQYLLMKHYSDEADAYTDFLKLIGKMCRKHEDSKYFLNHQQEDNRMICCNLKEEHMIQKEEKKIYAERFKAFEQFVLKNRMCF